MSEIEQINPTDSGKVAFEKTGRNIETIVNKINVLSSDTYIKLGNIERGTMLEAILKYVSQGYNKFECRCKPNNIVSDSPSSEWSSIRVNATEDFYYVECFTQFKAPNYFRKIQKSTGNWYIEWQQLATTDQINDLSKKVDTSLPMAVNGETIATRITNEIANGQIAGRYRYTREYSSDAPTSKHGIISYSKTHNSKYTGVTFVSDDGNTYISVLDSSNATYFSNWTQIATTTKTDISSYVNGWDIVGWGSNYKLRLLKTVDMVTICGVLTSGVVSDNTVICNIPQDYRPKTTSVHFDIFKFEDPSKCSSCTIYSNGDIKIRKGSILQGDNVVFSATYIV